MASTGQASSSAAIPQILTRSVVPELSEGLDAADILECYALVRRAPLHNAMLPDATITIHKVALGLRYRPLKMTDLDEEPSPREITLEYGPQRMGASLSQESMPSVQKEQSSSGTDSMMDSSGGTAANNNSTDDTNARSFLTWENEGKIYYTSQIASTGYVSAYYMASVTGAVLGKILEKAVEYPMANAFIRGRPRRYQPFVVVDGSTNQILPPGYEGEIPSQNNPKVMLRSSSDSDFMDYMWYTLAELGVSLHPILAPPTYQIQLLATGIEKVKVGPPDWVTQSAASFYNKLYMCIEAKVTGDYSKYAKLTANPTVLLAPSQAPTTIFSSNSTFENELDDMGDSNDGNGGVRRLARKRVLKRADLPGTPAMKKTNPPIDAIEMVENKFLTETGNSTTVESSFDFSSPSENATVASHLHDSTNAPAANVRTASLGGTSHFNNSSRTQSPLDTNATSGAVAGNLGNLSLVPSTPPETVFPSLAPSKINPKDTKTEVDKAQIAADQAKQAAAEAKDAAKTPVESKAANAAAAAADAAQVAADATSNAAAQAAMEALLSGDGATITSVLLPCVSDPQFGIARLDENETIISQAYLYLDGSSYYRLNLTFPFVQVVPVEHKLPQPRDFDGTGGGGDFVDWSLAFLIVFFLVFGTMALIQQVFGGYVKLFRPLFNFQIWFFNPLHYDEIKEAMEEEIRISSGSRKGRGHVHAFGQDAIPESMGGRRSMVNGKKPSKLIRRIKEDDDEDDDDDDMENSGRERVPLKKSNSGHILDDSESSHEACEIEMTEAKIPASSRLFQRASSRGSAESVGSASSLGFLDNGPTANGIVGNLELVEQDHRIVEDELPSRFTRDPDLVEMPNLKSTSKVAIPVGVQRNRSFNSSSGSTL